MVQPFQQTLIELFRLLKLGCMATLFKNANGETRETTDFQPGTVGDNVVVFTCRSKGGDWNGLVFTKHVVVLKDVGIKVMQ